MAKFPSQRKITYETDDISETTMASEGYINIPKDLSILNRRGYASTTRKGVPLVYQCKVDFYLQNYLGSGPTTAYNADLQATMKLTGCQNNWVMRNAAVKWHAAREEMFKDAGVLKRDRGAYGHEIRYNLDAAGQTWKPSIDGDGNDLTGGTWDSTQIIMDDDASGFQLKLVGQAISEDNSESGFDVQQIGYSYLASRATVPADSNLESSSTPGAHSVLNQLLSNDMDSVSDEVKTLARGEQDNPPYDEFVPGDVNADITEGVELGRAVAGFGNAYGSTIVEIPFGLAHLRAQIHDAAGTDGGGVGLVCVEVLDIYEMQG